MTFEAQRRWYDFGLLDTVKALGRPVMMYDVLDWDRDYSFNPDNKRLRAAQRADSRPLLHSSHPGVSYDRWSGKWRAQIRLHGKKTSLGKFPDEETAALVYQRALAKRSS